MQHAYRGAETPETSEWQIPAPAVIRFNSPGHHRVHAVAVAVLDQAGEKAN